MSLNVSCVTTSAICPAHRNFFLLNSLIILGDPYNSPNKHLLLSCRHIQPSYNADLLKYDSILLLKLDTNFADFSTSYWKSNYRSFCMQIPISTFVREGINFCTVRMIARIVSSVTNIQNSSVAKRSVVIHPLEFELVAFFKCLITQIWRRCKILSLIWQI
jgi:hypothetical protein